MRLIRLSALLLIFALCFCQTTAQSDADPDPVYHLRQPDATEYLTALAEIIPIAETTELDDESVVSNVIYEEFWTRYPGLSDLSAVPFEVLAQVNLFYLVHTYANFFEGIDKSRTLPGLYTLMLHSWLREYHPDLSTQDTWNLNSDYILEVQPVDLNGDGVDEVVVAYHDTDFNFRDYFVLQRDLTRPEGYRRVFDTNYWEISGCYPCGGDFDLYQLRDVTGDGLPEWMVRGQYCGYGKCWIYLDIYSWWHDAFVSLTPHTISMEFASYLGTDDTEGIVTYPPEDEGSWSFENLDNDLALEFIQTQYIDDTRGCEFSITTVYQLNETAGAYQPDPSVYEYADTPWCAMRQAHEAMVQLDFDAAIRYYEHFLTFTPPNDVDGTITDGTIADVWTYARTRLAMAYALAGQPASAAALLDNIHPESITDEGIRVWAEMVKTTFAANPHPLDFCAAVLDSFANQSFRETFSEDVLLNRYASTQDYAVSSFYGPVGDDSAEAVGCNLSGFWKVTVAGLNLQGDIAAQIKAAGWDILSIHQQDTNGDGLSEMLVQVSLSVQPFLPVTESWDWNLNSAFFWYDGENEHRAVVPLSELPADVTFRLMTLPDGSDGLGVIAYDDHPDLQCTLDGDQAPGFVRLWRVTPSDEFEDLISTSGRLCRRQSFEETFPTGDELRLYQTPDDQLTVLRWNGSYYAEPVNAETDAHIFCLYDACSGGLDDPANALLTLHEALANPPADSSPYYDMAFHYYRALILEALNRSDEALAEYVTVYESDPESVWGKLAALHLIIE